MHRARIIGYREVGGAKGFDQPDIADSEDVAFRNAAWKYVLGAG